MAEDLRIPKISVIMPVYNGGKYLKEAVDSILNQTYTDFELLLINDASTDNTENIINSYNDPRIVYIKNEENLGLIKTLNKGLDLAKGEFIARMDADDISHPERFERQVSIFEKNPEIGVCGTLYTMFGTTGTHKTVSHPQFNEHIKINLLTSCVIAHPSVMLRKSIIENNRYDENYEAAEDFEFWTRLLRVTQFYNIQESLLMYRVHNNNISVLQQATQLENTKKIIGNQLKYIGIENSECNIELCQTLFENLFKFRLTDDEFRKLIIFANILELQNQKTKFYDETELHKKINEKLLLALNKTIYKKLSTFLFLLKNRKEIITKRKHIANVKMLAKMMLKK